MMTLMERSPSPPSALAMPSPSNSRHHAGQQSPISPVPADPTLMDYEAIDVYWRRDIELEKSGLPYYVQPPVAMETDWSLDGADTAKEKGLDGLVLGMDGTDQFERDLQLLTEKQLMRPHVTTTPHPTSTANHALDNEDLLPWAHMGLGKESGLEAGQSFDDWLLPVPSPSTSALDDSAQLFCRDGTDAGDYLDDLELQSPFTSHLLRVDSCEGVEQPSTSKEEPHMQKVGAKKAVDATLLDHDYLGHGRLPAATTFSLHGSNDDDGNNLVVIVGDRDRPNPDTDDSLLGYLDHYPFDEDEVAYRRHYDTSASPSSSGIGSMWTAGENSNSGYGFDLGTLTPTCSSRASPFSSAATSFTASTSTGFCRDEGPRKRGRRSLDNHLVAENQLPATAEAITAMSHKELKKLLSMPSLTAPQRQLIKKIRRRGRNKAAARKCREKKTTDDGSHCAPGPSTSRGG